MIGIYFIRHEIITNVYIYKISMNKKLNKIEVGKIDKSIVDTLDETSKLGFICYLDNTKDFMSEKSPAEMKISINKINNANTLGS